MYFGPLVTLACLTLTPTLHLSDVVDSCANERMESLSEVMGRNAWAARCLPHVPPPVSYPQGDFVALVGTALPKCPEAPCFCVNVPAVVCTAEGVLAGSPVRTEQGLIDVAELVARGVRTVGTWDASMPVGASPEMVPLTRVLRRPYKGPVIYLETQEGAVLNVTAGQPVLMVQGWLMRADLLVVGDVLMGQDRKHYVTRVVQTHKETFSYQPLVWRLDFEHNNLAIDALYLGSARLVQDNLAPKHR